MSPNLKSEISNPKSQIRREGKNLTDKSRILSDIFGHSRLRAPPKGFPPTIKTDAVPFHSRIPFPSA